MNVSEFTLDDIRGAIALATDDEALRADKVDRSVLLDEIELWIKLRIEAAPQSVRSNWFREALAMLALARLEYEAGRAVHADEKMRRVEKQLNEGNRASRRDVSFLVASDGVVRPVEK